MYEYRLDSPCDQCNYRRSVVFSFIPDPNVERTLCTHCIAVPAATIMAGEDHIEDFRGEYKNMKQFYHWVIARRWKQEICPPDLVHPNPYIRNEAKKRYESS